jgi:multicomponent K+:H+ antiporter subunit F
MSASILNAAVITAQMLLVLAMSFALFRMTYGPRAQDRVLGLDTFYVNAMLLLVTIGVRTGSALYFEASLIIALLGFAGTVALSKFLMRGEVIE